MLFKVLKSLSCSSNGEAMGISYLHFVARKSKDRDEHVHYFGFCSLLGDLRESWRQSQPGLQLLPTAHRKLDLPKVVGSVVVFSFSLRVRNYSSVKDDLLHLWTWNTVPELLAEQNIRCVSCSFPWNQKEGLPFATGLTSSCP